MIQMATVGQQKLWKRAEMSAEELKAAYLLGKRDFSRCVLN